MMSLQSFIVHCIRRFKQLVLVIGLFCAFLFLPATASATHLMGGWAGYQYLGLNPGTGEYQYQVTLKIYRYCDDVNLPCGQCNTAPLDANCNMGAYIQDFLNPNDPNKVLAKTFTLPLTSSNWVPLPGAANCAVAPTVCVQEGIYTALVELPASNGGYHLIFERCCRNANILNLANPGGEGQVYYAFVPPTFINNSSPTFAQPPVPYICELDTASILNTAFDPDGDQIVYSLVHPYNTSVPQALPPILNPYPFPINLVTYAAGYNAAQPFGPGGYASVNAFTGISQYLAPAIGNYVVAVELKEYRNGQLVGITRLDMQIIVITCPPNNSPNLAPSTSNTSYVAQVGDTLCFPITFNDANGDSVFMNATGNIFGPPIVPSASVTPNPNAGPGTVTSQFCWNIGCAQAGNYIFIVQVPDNGCPPKVTNVVYTLQVLPFTGPTAITGPSPLCQNTNGTYSVPAGSATTYSWTVTGGTITAGQGSNSINVDWGTSSNGTVSLVSYSQNGCQAGPLTTNVLLQPAPVPNAAPNTTLCFGDSVALSSTGGGTYSWSPSTGLSNSSIANPVASPTTNSQYTVVVTSALGCTGIDSVSIDVTPQVVASAGNDPTICPGFSSTIGGNPTGPAGAGYVWSPSSGLNNSTIANPIATPTTTTQYTVITTFQGCSDTDTVNVIVTPQPVSNAGPDLTICQGNSATLNGTGGGTYNWSPSSGLNNSTIANPVATPTGSTTYTLVVAQGVCTDTDYVSVSFFAAPAVNAGADQSICIGDNATLNGSGGGSFSWSPASGLSCTTCANPVASVTSSTQYTLTVTDGNSCTNTDEILLTVNPLPLANAGPQPGWVCPGFGLTLNASNGVSYNWSPSSGLSNTTIANPVASPTTTTQYTVSIVDVNGCSNTDTVTVFQTPNIPTSAGNDQSLCVGSSITIGGSPTGPAGVNYVWSPSSGLNNSTIANPVATPTSSTVYLVTTSSQTCVGTATVSVSVNPLPLIDAGSDVSICIGQSITLTGSGGITYLWSNGSTGSSISISPTAATSYTLTGTDANGCSNTDVINVGVNQLPAITAGNNVSVCLGNATTLIATGGTSYLWNTGATTTSIVVAPTLATSYTVSGTDPNGCDNVDSVTVLVNQLPVITAGTDVSVCTGNSATLTAGGGVSYVWNTGAITSSLVVSPSSNTSYTVIGTDANGCNNFDSVSVFVHTLPAVNAGNGSTICIGNSATLNGTGGTGYTWSPSSSLNNGNISNPVATPTNSTTYTMVATDANLCSNTDTVTVIVLPLPIVTTSNDTAICIGQSAQLNAAGGTIYTWSPSSTLNNGNISNPVASPGSSTSYTVSLLGANGCTNTDSVLVIVNPLPLINAGPDTVLCPGDTLHLQASGGITYVWSPAIGLNNPNIANPDASPSVVTSYTVTGTDMNGCVNRDSLTVSIGIIPTANFGYDLSLACEGMTAFFHDSSLNATATIWNFGSAGSTDPNPSYTFPYSSNQLVILTALNPPCRDTAQTLISVNDLSSYLNISAPNVFTPNGDGINDCYQFNMNGRFAGCSNLTIFDRWGIPVFKSNDSGTCWDGHTSAGAELPSGTYFYIFDLNGVKLKGFLTLLR